MLTWTRGCGLLEVDIYHSTTGPKSWLYSMYALSSRAVDRGGLKLPLVSLDMGRWAHCYKLKLPNVSPMG